MRRTVEIAEFGPKWAEDVDEILRAAFAGPGEASLVRMLRKEHAATVELVAVENGVLVGHAFFSRVGGAPDTIRIAALAPISVKPTRQRAGIGSALIRGGLAQCKEEGIDAVVVLGDPAYYRRFGFTRRTAQVLDSVYSGSAFQAFELRDGVLARGFWRLTYPDTFTAIN